MSITAGAIAAGAVTAASSLGSTLYGTERNIANSNWQAQVQRDFEERMASTQYRRAVKDMEAAGLNPAAIGSGAGPNAVPSGAAATGNYGHGGFADFSNIFNSAVSAAMAKDKNFADKVVQSMKNESAEQVQLLRNQGFKELEGYKKLNSHSSYAVSEAQERYNALAKRYARATANLRK